MGIFTLLNVLDLLPHRPPLIMIDQLTHYDEKSARTVFTVRDDHLFCIDGRMEEAGLVENMAQTCAARTGFKQRLANGWDETVCAPDCGGESMYSPEKIKIGLIVMIETMEISRCPVVGEQLETAMVIEEEFFSTTFVRSEVKIGDETIATCRMKLFLTDRAPNE